MPHVRTLSRIDRIRTAMSLSTIELHFEDRHGSDSNGVARNRRIGYDDFSAGLRHPGLPTSSPRETRTHGISPEPENQFERPAVFTIVATISSIVHSPPALPTSSRTSVPSGPITAVHRLCMISFSPGPYISPS